MLRKSILLTTLVLLLLSGVVQAQSGRRSTGSSTSTTANTNTTAPATPGAKATATKSDTETRVRMMVAIDRSNAFTTTPFYVYDTVLQECIARLNQANIVFANAGGTNLTRGEASKTAKGETQRWVVSLEVRSIFAESGRQIKPEEDELFVDYVVYEPVTGKVKKYGRTQHHIYQSGGRGSASTPRNVGNYSEYGIKQAAIEVADKILAGFDIKIRD